MSLVTHPAKQRVLERALACSHEVGDLEAQRREQARMVLPNAEPGPGRDCAPADAPGGSAGEAATPGLVLLQVALAWHYNTTQQVQQHLRMAERALEQARLFHDHMVLLQAQRVYGLALHYLGR